MSTYLEFKDSLYAQLDKKAVEALREMKTEVSASQEKVIKSRASKIKSGKK